MDINFKSLSLSPSDHECQDGDLATMLNLVNEDGAMKPIPQPSTISNIMFKDADGNAITESGGLELSAEFAQFYIHTVDSDDILEDDHQNIIAVYHNEATDCDMVLWCDDAEDLTSWEIVSGLTGYCVTSLVFTGRIATAISADSVRWLQWNGNDYSVILYSDFDYNVHVKIKGVESDLIESDTLGEEWMKQYVPDFPDDMTMNIEGVNAFLDMVYAQFVNKLNDHPTYNMYNCFGICAIKMFDGSYIKLSDIFFLCGGYDFQWPQNYLSIEDDTTHFKLHLQTCFHEDTFCIEIPQLDKVKDLIQSVDIFFTAPSLFARTDRTYEMKYSLSPAYYMETLEPYSGTTLKNEIDNFTFHKVGTVVPGSCVKDVTEGYTYNEVKTFDETQTALNLGDFMRDEYGGQSGFSYNGRTMLAGVLHTFTKAVPLNNIVYHAEDVIHDDASYYGLFQYPSSKDIEAVFEVNWQDSYNMPHVSYVYTEAMYETVPAFLTMPFEGVTRMTIYTKKGTVYGATAHDFVSSETGDWSRTTNEILSPTRKWYQLIHLEGASGVDWPTVFAEKKTLALAGSNSLRFQERNMVIGSEADNPFAYKQSNSITVGAGSVLALAAPTKPVSLGQAGQTPMVAFTTEGLYPIYHKDDGSLYATQPGPRDVLAKNSNGNYNTESITSIDDAILFASSRGLMLYSGNETKCITDNLNGDVFGKDLQHLADIFNAAEGVTTHTSNNLQTYAPLSKLGEFLQDCKIIYDYIDQRIFVYSPDSAKVLVYSLRSGSWGATEYNYCKNINSYPDALAIGKSGSSYYLVNAHNSDPGAEQIPVNLVTRPLGMGEPDTLKRISSAIVRGYFAKGHVATALYGSRDLFNWFLINTSKDQYLRNRMGTPYKYFRVMALGKLDYNESIFGVSLDASGSLTNQQR